MRAWKSIRQRLQAIYPKTLGKASSVKQQGTEKVSEQSAEAETVLSAPDNGLEISSLTHEDNVLNGMPDEDDRVWPKPTSIDVEASAQDTTGDSSTRQESATSITEQEIETDFEDPRYRVYVRFHGEDEDDYTDGPIRLISTTDGLKQCTALLMNLDLSAKFQDALRAQRFFVKEEASAKMELEALENFDSELRRQVLEHEMRVAMLKHDSNTNESELESLKEELRILRLMREENKSERAVVSNNLEYQGTELRKIQSTVIADLEEPFVFANLLEAEEDVPNEPARQFDLQQEFQEFRANLDDDACLVGNDAAPFQTYTNNMEVFGPLTEQEARAKEAKDTWWVAYERLQAAKQAFSNRDAERTAEWDANFEAEARGEEAIDASREDYDMRMLKREQELTRELIDAEEGFAAAKLAARDAGLDLGAEDQTSEFVDDIEDGYRLSSEEVRIASVPEPVVHNWLDSMPSPATPSFSDRFDQGDEWQADDVEISDSISLVAEGAERRKIDKWRKVCGL